MKEIITGVVTILFVLEIDGRNEYRHIGPFALLALSAIESVAIYQQFSLILFVCLTSLASMSVHFLTEEVKIWYSSIHGVSRYRINRWQKIYFTILDLITEIDGFFGPMAVISIAYVFIQLVMNTSYGILILLGLEEENPIMFILKNIQNIILILGFIFGNEIIKRKVLECLIVSYRIFNH